MAKKLKPDTNDDEGRGGGGREIAKSVLRGLVNTCNFQKGKLDEARGEYGPMIKSAEDKHGIHRKAFKLSLTLDNMEPAARSDFLRAFDDYREKLGFDDQDDLLSSGDGNVVSLHHEVGGAAE